MSMNKRRGLFSWLLLGALLGLCVILGVLQYRWIGKVSRAERERLRSGLQASLERLSQDFNSEIAAEGRMLLPAGLQPNAQPVEGVIASRYAIWQGTTQRAQVFRRIGIAVPRDDTVLLKSLDMTRGVFEDTEWPAEWKALMDRRAPRRSPEPWRRREPPAPPSGNAGLTFDWPLFRTPPPGPATFSSERREPERLIVELSLPYVRDVMLPELLQRHLGMQGVLEYDVAVLTREPSPLVIYASDPAQARRIAGAADGTVGLFEPMFMLAPWPRGPGGSREGRRGPGPSEGRWQIFVRHRAGSLEAVVSRARRFNLAVAGGILLLVMASIAALVRYTRRAQHLAELQIEFVAGVSHELRTPLTVIHTAAYNLRGKLAHDPGQVEKYGELIQQESGRLTELVDQVLQFSSSAAGRSVQEREPLSIEAVMEETVGATRAAVEAARCRIERTVELGLPPILGDPVALKRAFANLIDNAATHGAEGSNWIGLTVRKAAGKDGDVVEVRVADRGLGIPADEQRWVFEPFYRGRRAVRDQIHGSGLGLNLVRKIVEAHGGTIKVRSEPGKGTEFIVRIPTLARE